MVSLRGLLIRYRQRGCVPARHVVACVTMTNPPPSSSVCYALSRGRKRICGRTA